MKKTRIKKGDTIIVISGRDKGKKGEVIQVIADKGVIYVKGVNLIKKTLKKSKEYPIGGIIKIEAPMHISNVMAFCPKVNKGVRIGFELDKDGVKKRVAIGCDYKFD